MNISIDASQPGSAFRPEPLSSFPRAPPPGTMTSISPDGTDQEEDLHDRSDRGLRKHIVHDPDRGTDHHRDTHGPFTGLKAAPGPEDAGDQRKKAQRTVVNPKKSRECGEQEEVHELTVRGEHSG